MSDDRVLVDGVPLDRVGEERGMTGVRLRGVPVLTPVLPARASVRGKTAPRRRNSRVTVSWTARGVGWRK